MLASENVPFLKPPTFDFSEMSKKSRADSATNEHLTAPVEPKTATQPVRLGSGHVNQSLCVLWCGHRLFVWFFMCFLWFAPHLRLTCASLDNDLISQPKHITTHLNPHLIYTNTHTCTSESLVAFKVSIRNKKTEKSECDMLSVFNAHNKFFVCV